MHDRRINTKIEISEAAAAEFRKHGRFTVAGVLQKTGLNAFELFSLFDSKNEIARFWYSVLLYKYDAMLEEIEEFDRYTLSEKISNFIYTSFEMLEEDLGFVQHTFRRSIADTGTSSEFFAQVKKIFAHFIEQDERLSLSSRFLLNDRWYAVLARVYIRLIEYRLDDDSPNRERSTALVDKIAVVIEELLYNKLPDKSLDLLRYLIDPVGIADKIPVIGKRITDYFAGKGEKDE